ncbi:MAG: rhodanese-like domain-containing protein [Bacteroidia bacterium]|nr:rhodanese-like domain-containing protein [Bacteroidia bacterium]
MENVTVIDVREPWEYMLGHVKGSLNIPMGKVPQKLDELKKMQQPLVFCCASGNRSGQVVSWLKSQGLKNITNGGSWRDVK